MVHNWWLSRLSSSLIPSSAPPCGPAACHTGHIASWTETLSRLHSQNAHPPQNPPQRPFSYVSVPSVPAACNAGIGRRLSPQLLQIHTPQSDRGSSLDGDWLGMGGRLRHPQPHPQPRRARVEDLTPAPRSGRAAVTSHGTTTGRFITAVARNRPSRCSTPARKMSALHHGRGAAW
ncbi:hypothetical protein C8R47DRAFT_1068666 [Mycena vitilis]|nr:hypothetical protein C8R47DRAFT_1068666 [Mycena vitilis]